MIRSILGSVYFFLVLKTLFVSIALDVFGEPNIDMRAKKLTGRLIISQL